MKDLKIGDRVRVYSDFTGCLKGTIQYRNKDGLITLEEFPHQKWHEKQCRRLIPKKSPREFWINVYGDNKTPWGYAYSSLEQAIKYWNADVTERIHVREARKK